MAIFFSILKRKMGFRIEIECPVRRREKKSERFTNKIVTIKRSLTMMRTCLSVVSPFFRFLFYSLSTKKKRKISFSTFNFCFLTVFFCTDNALYFIIFSVSTSSLANLQELERKKITKSFSRI